MKIVNVKSVGKRPVYDLSVNSDDYDKQQYVLENGVVTHNTGIYYSADSIWIIGRRQNKTGTEVTGYDFIVNVDKSRYVKEKSKIPISVSWDGGIDQYSGLLDVALAGGYVVKPSTGWYQKVGEDKKYRASELDGSFWQSILENTEFNEMVNQLYQIGHKASVSLELDEV